MKRFKFLFCILFVLLIGNSCHQSIPTEIANISPEVPVNIFPLDEATTINTEMTFHWQAEDQNTNDSLFFDFYLEAGNPVPELFLANLSVDSLFINSLKYDTTYYWKVVAKDKNGDMTGSPVWSFKTRHEFNSAPNMPGNPLPSNNAKLVPINDIVLKWHGGDPDNYSLVNYNVLFGERPDSLYTFVENQPDSTCPIPLLRYNEKYYWKIIAKDDYESLTEGPTWNFETLNAETIFSGSFDTDIVNESPSSLKWTVWDSLADIFVTDEMGWNNQGKSVCFTDSTIAGNSYLAASVAERKVGMLQFYFLMTSIEDYFGIRMYSEVADSNHFGPQISIREGKLQYYDNSRAWQIVKPVNNNSWYCLQLVFDCNSQFYNIYLNERLVAEKVTWTGTVVPNLNLFYFLTFQNRKCNKFYIDEVKFFSDP